MCSSNKSVKFCTCSDGERLLPPFWILHRRDRSREEADLMGQLYEPDWTDSEKAVRQAIVDDLRVGGCFDFDYEPAVDDIITVVYGPEADRWEYRYEASEDGQGRWQIDEGDQFATWRSQLVRDSSGPMTWQE